MGIQEKIKDIEEEIAKTQKNKATEHHIGLLKGRLAKLRSELIEGESKGKGGSMEGFETRKTGDARVALIGFPSVGKSTLLNKLTGTSSEVASYEYTTLTCVPGNFEYKGSKIQILDLPGIIEEASRGKGRGKQVIAIARTADLIIMMLDATKGKIHKTLLTRELENAGIRINRPRPNISITMKSSGNIGYNSVVKQTKGVTEKLVREILKQRKVHHCDILIREDVTIDEIIDVIEGNRVYSKCLYVYNKIDNITIEEMDKLAREPNSCVLSLELDLNVENIKRNIWESLDLIRVYSKKKGRGTDFEQPFIIPTGSTIESICNRIHKDLHKQFKYAVVYGRSVKHQDGQHVGLSHVVEDEDVVSIIHRN